MSDFIDRIAKAQWLASDGADRSWEALPEPNKNHCRRLVRAGLEAARTPDGNMRFYGQNAIGNDLRFVSPQDIWQAMIDGSLKLDHVVGEPLPELPEGMP